MYPFDSEPSAMLAQQAQATREEILKALLEQSQTLPPNQFSTFEGGMGADMRQRQGPQIDPMMVADAAQAIMQRMQEAAQNLRTAQMMQEAARVKGHFGVDPLAADAAPWERAQSLAAKDNPQAYMAAALRERDLARAGKHIPLTAMQGPWMGAAVNRLGPALEFTPEQLAAIEQRKQERANQMQAARDIIASRAQGITPGQFRADVGRATPVDLALIGGQGAAQAHPDWMAAAAEDAQKKIDAEREQKLIESMGGLFGVLGSGATPPPAQTVLDYAQAFQQALGSPGGSNQAGGGQPATQPAIQVVRGLLGTNPELLKQFDAAIVTGGPEGAKKAASAMQIMQVPEPLGRQILQTMTGSSLSTYRNPAGIVERGLMDTFLEPGPEPARTKGLPPFEPNRAMR